MRQRCAISFSWRCHRPARLGLKPPDHLDAVCLKALDRDPDKRFQTAQDMANAIRAAAIKIGDPGSASGVSAWVRKVAGDKIELRRRAIGDASSTDSSIRTVPLLVESSTNFGVASVRAVPPSDPVPVGTPNRWQRAQWSLVLIPLAVIIAVLFAFLEPRDETVRSTP